MKVPLPSESAAPGQHAPSGTPPGVALLGEALFDSFDGIDVPGGAPLNVACHLQALGIRVRLVTRVGSDEAGRTLLAFLKARGLDLSGVQRDGGHRTGRVTVRSDGVQNRFEILDPSAWDFLDLGEARRAVSEFRPSLVYFGTLALRRPASRDAILSVADDPGPLRFCDLNLRPPWFDGDTVREALTRGDVVKLNGEELVETVRLLGLDGSSDAARSLLSHFRIRTLVVTRGERGARRLDRTADGIEEVVVPGAPPDGGVADTVGAGDAFAAVVAVGLLEGWDPIASVSRADELARRIVAVRGALPTDPSLYRALRAAWRDGG